MKKIIPKFIEGLLYVIVFLIPFNMRKFILSFSDQFSEYNAIFFYLIDVFILLFIILNIKKIKSSINLEEKQHIYFLIFLLISFFSLFISTNFNVSLYSFLRLILYILMCLSVIVFLKNKSKMLDNVFLIILGTSLLESILAFLQFSRQHSLGLWFLGESKFGPLIPAVAKIMTDHGPLVRPYGTFLHPNILGAFLILGLFSAIYFRLKISQGLLNLKLYYTIDRSVNSVVKKLFVNIFLGIIIFMLLFGLILTFSRAAWLSFAVMFLTLSIYLIFWKKEYRKIVFALVALVIISLGLIYNVAKPFVKPRLKIYPTDSSLNLRASYNNLGLSLIKKYPLLGVGIGNQTFYARDNEIYKIFGLNQLWQMEPIHNLYLLIGSEIGLLGLVAFLGFLFKIVFSKISKVGIWNLEFGISKLMLASILLMALFDHFFWTIDQGKLMFWFSVALAMGSVTIKSLRSPAS